ncbi:GNAT family N-acetyltransferase [Nocardioides sp. Kera G14]|uniref:GNAT family N-acetyltransferase n=1 Tax=Nocardioides sp. Kera G14 TaxID=2884264 RepID=UPI001D10274C|nr:GNAT family N-acetyltransferase [Nocardioides sp. Kera G14]UDY22151.1 GNAT family N-acetyltransferase [Nocardioides sp. Kera G14]
MLPEVISTDRLTLPLWDARDVAAIRGEIPRSPHWHPDFPRQDDADAATMWHEGDMWGPRSIVRGQTVLGSIGFFGPPTAAVDGVQETEVGFGLVEEARGWGFATEALCACVTAAEAQGVRLRASVEPTNKESLRVLAKAGLTTLRGANDDGHLVFARPFQQAARRLEFAIRPTTEADWERVRAFRIENAEEHPISYGATVEAVREFDEEAWRMRARRGEQPDSVSIVAVESGTGRWIGMMHGLAEDEDGSTPVLAGVYVSKLFRGRGYGVADALLAPVLDWATGRASEIRLWVFEGSQPARRFYGRHGFVDTGRTKPLTLDPSLGNLREMRRRF